MSAAWIVCEQNSGIGMRAFIVDRLTRVPCNPAKGLVTLSSGGSVVYQTTVGGVQAPRDVVRNSARMVDVFAKAGVELTSTRPNLAQGAAVSAPCTASGTSTGAAVAHSR
ncbi:hypothetical protein JNUCC0626_13180 [Lentzea sp. JNUCC 0626]|uniref:hypothetical protein n=1 Tax=Lentzea sp. JNUCC 0626 TaxID=3367513 RepID=UPI00374785BC